MAKKAKCKMPKKMKEMPIKCAKSQEKKEVLVRLRFLEEQNTEIPSQVFSRGSGIGLGSFWRHRSVVEEEEAVPLRLYSSMGTSPGGSEGSNREAGDDRKLKSRRCPGRAPLSFSGLDTEHISVHAHKHTHTETHTHSDRSVWSSAGVRSLRLS